MVVKDEEVRDRGLVTYTGDVMDDQMDDARRGEGGDRGAEGDSATGCGGAEGKTKMQVATEIYKRMKRRKQVTRKEIIEQFISEAGLSKDGASTYYQMIKRRHER